MTCDAPSRLCRQMGGLGLAILAGILGALSLPGGAFSEVVTVPKGAVVIAEGDSLTYGRDVATPGRLTPINGSVETRSPTPYPDALQAALRGGVQVLNHGYPGDRSVDGLVRWQDDPRANLVIIMYGTNDTGDFRPSHEGRLTPSTYGLVLADLARRAQQGGAKVIIMAPPPARDADTDASIQPYREEAERVARRTGATFLNPASAIRLVRAPWTDGLHLTPAGYGAIASSLAAVIAVE